MEMPTASPLHFTPSAENSWNLSGLRNVSLQDPLHFTMKTCFRTSLAILSFALCLASRSVAEDIRLTKSLAPAEFTDAGLQQLSSDQTAILDALVRRDLAISLKVTREPRAARFSQRLTADERKNSGLSLLSEAQLARLDEYVARLVTPPSSGSGLSSSGGRSGEVVTSTTLRRAPEIHGMISLMYGAGSGGYSERGGAMVLTYDDPSGVSLAVGYSEIRTKGGSYYRDCRDRFYGGLERPFW